MYLHIFDGEEWVFAQGDRPSSALVCLPYAVHMVHEGSHFFYIWHQELQTDEYVDYLITAPTSPMHAHIGFNLDGSAITQWEMYKGTDKIGIEQAIYGNNDGNSAVDPELTVHVGVTGGTTDGTLVAKYKGGSTTNQAIIGISSGTDQAVILESGVKYILRVTSFSDDNLTNIRLSWYEHENVR